MYPEDDRKAPRAPDRSITETTRAGGTRGCPPLGRASDVSSEGDDALDHEALELAAAADVARGEGRVALADELELREHVRGHEPAAADLGARHRDVVRDARELPVHRVVPAPEVEPLAGEPVQPLARELPQRAPRLLPGRGPGHGLDVPEELRATELDERVDHDGRHVVPHP